MVVDRLEHLGKDSRLVRATELW